MTNNWQRWKGIMKMVPFEEKRLAKWQPPYIVQPKLDGVRCRVVRTEAGNSYILLSSEENVIFGVPHLNELFDRLNPILELDGELYCHGMSFEHIVSITSRSTNLHPDHKNIQFHCFDVIDSSPQLRRQITIEALKGISPWIVVVPFYLCESLEEVLKAYDSYLKQGYEGIIVRHKDNLYERKRSTLAMKFKPKKEDDYIIVGMVEEISKNGLPKDRLGALVCDSGDGRTFNVGSGFTDENRHYLWNAKDMIVGMTARVRYQHITSGNKVPRFPVFVEVITNA